MKRVFECIAVYQPTDKEREDGKSDEIIVPLMTLLAKDAQSATLAAARAIPEEFADRLDQVLLATRPF